MKNLVDGREFRNLKDKVKKYGRDNILEGTIFERVLELIISMEGQIHQLNKRIEKLEGETNGESGSN